MKKAILLGTAGVAAAFAMLAFGFLAGKEATRPVAETPPATVQATAEKPLDSKAVELIVRDYLLANPELLIEVQTALDAKQKEEQRIANLGVIKNARDDIFNSSSD